MRIHQLLQHIQARVETDLRVWRYLLPPGEEKDGHEILGTQPVWQPTIPTDHFICQIGNRRIRKVFYYFSLQMDVTSAT